MSQESAHSNHTSRINPPESTNPVHGNKIKMQTDLKAVENCKTTNALDKLRGFISNPDFEEDLKRLILIQSSNLDKRSLESHDLSLENIKTFLIRLRRAAL